MFYEINETHDPDLKSWVESANSPDTDFPIQNLPLCTYEIGDTQPGLGIGFVIGDKILDIYGCIDDGLMLNEAIAAICVLSPLEFERDRIIRSSDLVGPAPASGFSSFGQERGPGRNCRSPAFGC